MCLGHQGLKNTHEIVCLGAVDRPNTWRNITLLWLGKKSSKRFAICKNRLISGGMLKLVGVAGYHDAPSVGGGFEVVAVVSQICLASGLHGPATVIQLTAQGHNKSERLDSEAGRCLPHEVSAKFISQRRPPERCEAETVGDRGSIKLGQPHPCSSLVRNFQLQRTALVQEVGYAQHSDLHHGLCTAFVISTCLTALGVETLSEAAVPHVGQCSTLRSTTTS